MRVAVIGAGASGLRAAMLLEAEGVDVTVFEARSRVGGRIWTARDGSVSFDAGGEWIDAEHGRVLSLAENLGLTIRPTTGIRWAFHRGEKATTRDLWPEAEADEAQFEERARALALGPGVAEEETLGSLIDSVAKTQKGKWWLTANYRSDEGDDLNRIALDGWLLGYRHYLERTGGELSAYSLEAGMGGLTDGMAARLAKPVVGATDVQAIDQNSEGVVLRLRDRTHQCDRVIVTAPPPALERIEWDISRKKRAAWSACAMGRAIKIALLFKAAWWRDIGWTGSMFTDILPQQTWDGTRGGSPVLLCYVCGDEADALRLALYKAGGLPCDESILKPTPSAFSSLLTDALSKVSDRAHTDFLDAYFFDWVSTDGGAFSYMPPGYLSHHFPVIATQEGRVHFAGEYTSSWTGFIEGALESAERAVGEVLAC